jgi:predicted aspartyl protease
MKSKALFRRRNTVAGMLCCGLSMWLPTSGAWGQAPPQAPPPATNPLSKPPAQMPMPIEAQTQSSPPTQTQVTPVVQAKTAPVVQTPSTAPIQIGPITLPANASLPVSLNLLAWLGFPTTTITINGSNERFGISTGLNANTVSPATVTRLQIPEGKTKVRVDILDREAEALETTLKSLEIGLLKMQNVSVAQVDVVSLLSRAPHPDAPVGWLGTPFLTAFHVTLDLAHKVCILEKPQTKMPVGAMIVPMTLRDGRIYVSMMLPKSKPFQAVLDTGAVLTLIPASVAEKLKLPALEVVKLSAVGEKPVQGTLIQAPLISVGKAECKALRVVYLSADASPGFGRETAILGLDFLSRFKVVLDFAAKKVAFVPLPVTDSSITPHP